VAGNADVLVTGDQDLLAVAAELPMRVLEPRAFWELLRAGEP
jgi:predicted nucleic acid-binding protein